MTMFRMVAIAACLATTPAYALDKGDYRFNGFGTVGATHLGGEAEGRSYGAQGQINDSWRGDAISKLGAQFQYGLTDKLNLTGQALVQAEQDSWGADIEWLYASFQATDRLVLRGGRLRAPVYMYSETLDVGFTYPWLRLPDEVYHQVQLSNYEGVDAIYTLPLTFGSVSFQANAGQAKNREYFIYDTMLDMDYDSIAGLNASLVTNSFGTVRLSYSEADLTLEGILDGNKGKFTSLGYQYDNGSWLTANEATRLVTEGSVATKTAFYLMAGRRIGDFLPHLTYAQLDEEKGGGRQSSWTYGLNYALLPNVTLKGEYKRVDTSDQGQGVFVQSGTEYFTEQALKGLFGTPASTYDGDIVSVGVDFVF